MVKPYITRNQLTEAEKAKFYLSFENPRNIEYAEIPDHVIEDFNSHEKVSDEEIKTLKKALNIPENYKMKVCKGLDFKNLLESMPSKLKTVYNHENYLYGVEIDVNAKYAYVSVSNPDDISKELIIKSLILRKCLVSTGYKYYVDYPMTNLFIWIEYGYKICDSAKYYFSKEPNDLEALLRMKNILDSILKYSIATTSSDLFLDAYSSLQSSFSTLIRSLTMSSNDESSDNDSQ